MTENLYECIKSNNFEKIINAEFVKTFNKLENSTNSFLVTGKAGTGKSTFLRFFKEKTRKNVVVVAPTGLSALNVGGQTIHSFFRLPPRVIEAKHVKRVENNELYKKIDAILIDEVSMVRADVMDGIDKFMRKNGKDNNKPFGGVQVLMFGDLFQLPPVADNSESILNYRYDSPYFFSSNIFNELFLEVIELGNVYRQSDEDFIALLDSIRNGKFSEEELSVINSRVIPEFKLLDDSFIVLTPTNKLADKLNNEKLQNLSGELFSFNASFEGGLDSKSKSLPVEPIIYLKKGARVILLRNDPNGAWVNGSLGVVSDFGSKSVIVELDSGSTVSVEKVSWDKIVYKVGNDGKVFTEITGKITQFPIKLAWALTIHKSQGQTFDKVFIDLSSGAFTHGQTYVALSRCRTLNGIILKSPVKKRDIIVDNIVLKFFKEKQLSLEEV